MKVFFLKVWTKNVWTKPLGIIYGNALHTEKCGIKGK